MNNKREKTISSNTKYKGHIINVRVDNVELENGERHFREVAEHPGGVVIIPMVGQNKIALIKQWRYPVDQELIELPAGKLNKGEDPLFAAKRELQEETGFIANSWQYLGYIYTTPGFCDEKLYFYKAEDLTFYETNFDDGEIIEPYTIKFDDAIQMIKQGKITDAKTIIGLNYINLK